MLQRKIAILRERSIKRKIYIYIYMCVCVCVCVCVNFKCMMLKIHNSSPKCSNIHIIIK